MKTNPNRPLFMTHMLVFCFSVLFVVACGNSDPVNGAAGGLCSASSPCPSGQFCFNGLCAVGCQSNANCAADQYCDTQYTQACHNKVVKACPETPCATGQICVSGLCSTPPAATQCNPQNVTTGNDGCESNALCIDSVDDEEESKSNPKCYTFPPCGENKTCPVGAQGAVCNDGLIPNKGYVCLTGLCKTSADCPAEWTCSKPNASSVIGMCATGSVGSPCNQPSDCQSGNCMTAAPGFPGVCL